ncbi:MAG: hypothetical protein U1A77_17610 [Pirellulales bacterium]
MLFDFSWFRRRAARKQAQAQSRQRAKKRRMFLESLEGRRVLATITLNDAADSIDFSGAGVNSNLSVSFLTDTYTITDSAAAINVVGTLTGVNVIGSGTNTVTFQATDPNDIDSLVFQMVDGTDSVTVSSLNDPLNILGAGATVTLNGPNAAANWSITGSGSGQMTGAGALVSFSGISTVVGGTSTDTFDTADGSSITVNGGGGTNSLSRGSGTNTWNISGSNSGSVSGTGSISFSNIQSVTGGTGTDGFTIASGASLSGSINGAGGTNTLTQADGSNTWTITGSNSGSVTDVTGGFSNIQSLVGGTGTDVFNLDGAFSGSIDGGSGSSDRFQGLGVDDVTLSALDASGADGTENSLLSGFTNIEQLVAGGTASLQGLNVASTWDFDGTPTYTTAGGTLSFSTGFTFIHGGSDVDQFNVTAATSLNSLSGNLGNDIFDIDAALTAGSINGGAGTDILQGNLIDNVFLTNANASGFDGTESSISGGFNDIETLTGNGGTLTGQNLASTWDLDGTPTYTEGGDTLNFSGFATLAGGSDVDQFNVTAASAFNLQGGGGNDVFDIDAALTGSVNGTTGSDTLQGNLINTVSLTGSGAEGFTGTEADISGGFSNIDTLTGNAGTTLTGQNSTGAWGLDGTPTYVVSGITLNFSGFGTIQGGTAVDTFNVTSATAMELRGGGAADIYNLSATLTGNIVAEAGQDEINFSTGGSVTGNVDGGSSAQLDYSGVAGPVTVSLTAVGSIDGFQGTASLISGTFDNINDLIGSASGADVLNGTNNAATWGLDGTPAYVSGQTLTFSSMETLNGGSSTDDFSITAATTASVTGGGGTNTYVFGNSGSLTGSITGGAGTDTITGDNDGNTFVVTGANAGTLTGKTSGWSGVENLTGGTGTDSFTINSGATLSGNIVGGSGSDTLAQADGANTWNITGADAGTVTDVTGTFSGIENVTGGTGVDGFTIASGASLTGAIDGGAGTDTISQTDGANTWNINGAGSGTASDTGGFSNIENLVGGSGADSFTFANAGSLTGSVDGGTGTDTLTGDNDGNVFVVTGADAGTLAGKTSGWSNIENLTGGTGADSFTINSGATLSGSISGGNGTDSLVQADGTNAWLINASNGGTVTDVTGTFSGIENLTGGTGDDTFTFTNSGVIGGAINGTSGNDSIVGDDDGNTFVVTGTDSGTLSGKTSGWSNIDNLTGGAGTDTFTINSGATLSGNINGAGGNDSLIQVDGANTWNVTGANAGTVTDLGGSFSNIENLTGGTGVDSFSIASGATLSGNINGGSGTDSLTQADGTNAWLINATNGGTVTDVGGTFSNIENLNGGTGADTFTFLTTGSVAGSVNGTSGNDTLVGDNDGNDFAVTGADSGTLAAKIGGTWSNIDNLVGGTQADTFTMGVAGSLSGSLDGGQGADLLDYSAYGTSVSVDLTAGPPGTATNITGGLLAGTGGDIGSSIEHVFGGSAADTIVGDVDVNTIRGNGGSDTINARAGIDNVDAGAGTDLIQISGTEAEFDVMQGGPGGVEDPTDYDILRNIGGGNVTLNGFNTVFNVFTNSIDEYQGNGFGILGNGNANELHFGFATMTNTTSLNSGTNNDDVTTSHANVSEVAYDGDAGTDNVTLVLTPDQFGALTTAEIFIVQDYVINPTGKTLSLTADDLKGNFTATNFETAQIAVYDDDIIVDITTCFLAIVSEDQIVEGTMGDDTLTGTNLTDLIFGEDGNDVIYGGNASDCIFGGANNDTIYGENLNDLLVGGSGNDTLYGGADEDTIFGNTGVDQLFGEFGHDTLDGGAGNDSLDGGADHDTLNGGPDVDTVLGGSSPDRILIRGAEATTDTIDGGSEYDTLEIIAGTGTATLQGFSLANTGVETVSSIEAIVGNNQTLQGTGGANLFDLTGIVGPTGLASIDGLGGNDTITGSASSDVINGGDGDDILTGGDGFDVINGGNDNDTIDGGLHNDTINGGAGLDTITAGAGFDVVQVSSNEAENDVMNGGADTDTIVALGVSAITLNGFNSLTNSFEGWVGNGLSIQGNGGGNTLNFQLIGTMTGVPFIDGGSGNDTITGTNGVDELRGSDGDDVLIGLGGTDTLRGGNNNDSLNGGDAIDQLYGDAGSDTITTGAGRDVVYIANDDTLLDTITDFALYSDYINLSAYGLGWTYGNLTFVVGVGYREVQLPAPFAAKRIRLNGWTRNPGSSQFQF